MLYWTKADVNSIKEANTICVFLMCTNIHFVQEGYLNHNCWHNYLYITCKVSHTTQNTQRCTPRHPHPKGFCLCTPSWFQYLCSVQRSCSEVPYLHTFTFICSFFPHYLHTISLNSLYCHLHLMSLIYNMYTLHNASVMCICHLC